MSSNWKSFLFKTSIKDRMHFFVGFQKIWDMALNGAEIEFKVPPRKYKKLRGGFSFYYFQFFFTLLLFFWLILKIPFFIQSLRLRLRFSPARQGVVFISNLLLGKFLGRTAGGRKTVAKKIDMTQNNSITVKTHSKIRY